MAARTEMQIRKKMENKGLGRDVAKNYQDICYLLNLFLLEGADAWLVCYMSIVKTPTFLTYYFLNDIKTIIAWPKTHMDNSWPLRKTLMSTTEWPKHVIHHHPSSWLKLISVSVAVGVAVSF